MTIRHLYLPEIIIGIVLIYNSTGATTLLKKDGLQLMYHITYGSRCYSDNGRFQIILRIPLSECVTECSLRNYCDVLQYNVRFHSCELFTSLNEEVEQRGCVIVNRSDMDITQFPCAEECQYGMSCDLNTKQCVYKECLEFPSAEHGTILGNRKEIGNKIRLKCDNGEEDVGQNTAECQANGSWNDFPQTCTQISVSRNFQCPESDMTYTDVLLDEGTTFTYRFVHELQLNQSQAFQYCMNEGAHLISRFPASKKAFLLFLMTNCTTDYHPRYWIDGNNLEAQDFDNLSEWVTSNGELLTADFWLPGQPNDAQTDHCVYVNLAQTNADKLLCDWDCDDTFYFICEK